MFKGSPLGGQVATVPRGQHGPGRAAGAGQHLIFATTHLSPSSQARATGAERLGRPPGTRTGTGQARAAAPLPGPTGSGSSRSPPSLAAADPTLAPRPAPTANAQALHEDSTVHAQKVPGAEGSAPSGVIRDPGFWPRRELFINTPRGHRRGVTLKVVGSEVRGQQGRRRGDPSIHLHKLQTACRAQPSRPTAISGC